MSILIHMCTLCGHQERAHESAGSKDGYMSCECCRGHGWPVFDPEPTLVETWPLSHGLLGSDPEPLYEPGATWNAGTGHRIILCSCQACKTRYAELTG